MSGTRPTPGSPGTADICPVCKSNRYLNPNLTFLINPECYHKMCTSCVDRLFTSGPAPCPVAGCHKTLRKRGFHKAFFSDLVIEREVDVRKRVGAIFNRREAEFETLKDWNNYLEEVEGLVFEIVNGTDQERKKAEERLKQYKEENERDIKENMEAEMEMIEEERRREAAELEAGRRRRERAAQEMQEEREIVERTKRETLNRLANSEGGAKQIARQAERAIAKTHDKIRGDAADAGGERASGFAIRGLKQKKAAVVEKPFDPFGGLDLTPTRYVLQDDYANEWLRGAKDSRGHTAGGYDFKEYFARTMFEAFSGLGVFIEDEAAGKGEATSSAVGTAAAGIAAGTAMRTSGQDVF